MFLVFARLSVILCFLICCQHRSLHRQALLDANVRLLSAAAFFDQGWTVGRARQNLLGEVSRLAVRQAAFDIQCAVKAQGGGRNSKSG